MLNIAEGASRFSNAEKRNFYVIARGSVIECVAILELLYFEKVISVETYINFYSKEEEISKMFYSMIKFLGVKKTVWVWKIQFECECEDRKFFQDSKFHTHTTHPQLYLVQWSRQRSNLLIEDIAKLAQIWRLLLHQASYCEILNWFRFSGILALMATKSSKIQIVFSIFYGA